MHQPMHDQPLVLSEYDDRTALQFRWFALSNGHQIARPKGRDHAGPGNLQMYRPFSARYIGNKIATRRLKVRLGDHIALGRLPLRVAAALRGLHFATRERHGLEDALVPYFRLYVSPFFLTICVFC
jgi:hypothetical protein